MTDRKGTNVTTIVLRRTITKKGTTKRKAMPSVDRTNRIPNILLSWKSARVAHDARDENDEREDGYDDECPKGSGVY